MRVRMWMQMWWNPRAAWAVGVAVWLPVCLPGRVEAQGPGARGGVPPAEHAAARDSTMLDFSNAEIGAVITAVANAGGVDVTYSDLPAKRITMRVHRPTDRQSAVAVLRSVVQANGLHMEEQDSLVTIFGERPPQQGRNLAELSAKIDSATAESRLKLFTYRLKYANATALAAVLQAVFAGGAVDVQTPQRRGRRRQQDQDGGGTTMSIGFTLSGGGTVIGTNSGNGDSSLPQQLNNLLNQAPAGRQEENGQALPIIIVPEQSTNSLLVRATPEDWESVRQAIEAVDLRPLQVLLEVVVAEVQRTDNLNVGVSASASNQRTAKGPGFGSVTLKGDTTNDFIARLTRLGKIDINLAISALQSRGNVRILSRPLVFAENNMESSLLVGSQRPFIQSFTTDPTLSTAQNQIVQYRDVGTSLTILPTINPDGYVELQVQQEVSAATNEIQFGAPVISTREATASLLSKDGETVVLGGLAGTQDQVTRSGIPVLSALPGIGGLFRSTQKSKEQTELFLFLTPHIVRSDADAQRIRQEIQRKSTMLHTVPTAPLVTPTKE